jgi:hypothetical protein
MYALFSQLFAVPPIWIFLEVEIFQSTFGGEPIKNRWRATYR